LRNKAFLLVGHMDFNGTLDKLLLGVLCHLWNTYSNSLCHCLLQSNMPKILAKIPFVTFRSKWTPSIVEMSSSTWADTHFGALSDRSAFWCA
jgi:hypothetical protein